MAKKIAPTYIGKLEQSKAGIEQILNPIWTIIGFGWFFLLLFFKS